MKNFFFIFKTFNQLKKHKLGKLMLIFILTLFLGINSGFSIVLLIPLLELMNAGKGETTEGLALFFNNLAQKTNITFNLETILVIYVILLTVMALLQYWKSLLDAEYQQTFIYGVRRRLFRKIIMADWQLLNNKSKTNHLQVLTNEVPNLANYYYFYIRLITSFIMTLSYIAWAMMVSAKFTGIIVIVGIVLFIVLRKFLFKAFHLGEGYINSYNRLLKYIDDFWQTVKIAKVHNSEDFYDNKFNEASASLLDLEFRMQKNYSLPQLIYRVSGILILVFVIYAGYRFDQVPLTSFFILILLFARIFPQFVAMNTDVNIIITNVPSVKMIMQLDEEFKEHEYQPVSEKVALPLIKEIRLDKINFSYPGGEKLFNDFTEIFPAKKITGIIGTSGRGKTTLIDIVAGLQKPDSGNIFIDNQLLNDESVSRWKGSIGYLPQDSFFIDGSLRENLVWDSSQSVGDKEIKTILEQVNAIHLLERFKEKLDANIVNFQYNFSGGECQRLALARVLLRKPNILILDEATSSLDPENERIIMDVLSGLKNSVTIIFVTHRTSVIPWFDKIIDLGDNT